MMGNMRLAGRLLYCNSQRSVVDFTRAFLPFFPHQTSQCSGKTCLISYITLCDIEAVGAADQAISPMRIRIMTKCSYGTGRVMLKQIGYIV